MKKILSAIALAASVSLGYSQGTIVIQNTSSTYFITTNTAAYGSGNSGVSGPTANVANSFYYALLFQNYTGSLTTNNVGSSAGWTFGEYGTNVVTGGVKGPGGTAGAAIAGWAAPAGATYDTGSRKYYVLVGWSANLGSTWSEIQAQLDSGTWVANGFFGVSALGNGYAGGGPNSLIAPPIWGTGINAGGLTSGFNLYSVSTAPVPEPGTLVLAGLGGLSLLAFRRKK